MQGESVPEQISQEGNGNSVSEPSQVYKTLKRRNQIMRFWKSAGVLFAIAVLSLVFVPRASASESDQKTIVTFNEPVEIPGKVLTPGTYTFKVLDTGGSRDVIQVLDKNETHAYATFIALPATIDKPSEKPFIRFAERPAGSPPAIEAWFYPGRTDGHEFVYPRQRASELAKANNQNVASMPNNMASNITDLSKSTTQPSANDTNQPSVVAMRNAPVNEVTPEDNDVEYAEVTIVTLAPPAAGSMMQADISHANSKHELPKTASELPLLALIGALSVAAGLTLRLFAKQPA
jgi:hypothetical protein